MVSARALSYESPTLPTEGSTPASARRSVYLMETYWLPLTPFCLSSGNLGGVDFSAALSDEREDLGRDNASGLEWRRVWNGLPRSDEQHSPWFSDRFLNVRWR